VAAVLRPLPNDIRIEGHTDNVPIAGSGFPSNWHLSVARATNTAFYLMDKEGLPPERVTVVGYAEYHPIASNETPAGRTNNRRVDIVILN
jgi:chemotaxis protein MotB